MNVYSTTINVNTQNKEGVLAMKRWRRRMKEKRTKKRDNGERFSFFDFLLELLFWIPEVLIFPFRLVYWLVRGIGKIIGELWSF
jgi:hypothetical protein